MSGNVVEFDAAQEARFVALSQSPPLPIEKHIVSAALAAERLRALSEQLLLVLQHAPRDADMFTRVHGEALTAWCDMDDHYRAYQAVLECKGQA